MRGDKRALNSTRLIRSFNAVSVLQTLYQEGSATRARLTEVTKMSPATITRIIAELLKQRVIIEERIGESNGGRRPVIFKLNHDRLFVAGVQILRDQVALAVADIQGRIVAKKAFQQYSLDPGDMVAEIASAFQALLGESAIDHGDILGVGLAISGIVDHQRDLLLRSVNLGWREVKISALLENALELQVFVENDANAAALAEYWFGGAKDATSLLYVKTASGVGAGIIYERRLLTGAKGMAGEIGHIPLFREGRPCRCGQSGCLESYLYLPDVIRRYTEESGTKIAGSEEFFARAAAGDPIARQLVGEASGALTTVVSFAAALMDLELLIIGGVWGRLGPEFLGRIEREIHECLERAGLNKTVPVRGSELGEDSDLLGAVGLVINHWFTPPI
jgi:N-acetylglucosamine repressor